MGNGSDPPNLSFKGAKGNKKNKYNFCNKFIIKIMKNFHLNLITLELQTSSLHTVETRIKEPVFIRTLRLKFNLLNPIIKNAQEAEIWKGS